MLECQALVLRSHLNGAPIPVSAAASLLILDRSSGNRLGCVERSAPVRLWSRWLVSSAWDVFETDDQSHLFSLRRTWAWSAEWSVRDAEGHTVGTILTPPARFAFFLSDVRREVQTSAETRIEDARGLCIARSAEMQEGCRFESLGGEELGCLSRHDHGAELSFADGATENPFTRMLLLAAAVLQVVARPR